MDELKKHLKHMYSDKTEHNITTQSKALAGVQEITSNFDTTTKVIRRQDRHTAASALADEMSMLRDLRNLQPFRFTPGRAHRSFPDIPCSALESLDARDTRAWLQAKKYQFATELGN